MPVPALPPQSPPRERPIVLSGPMVRAIREGRKTMFRRVISHMKWISKTAPGIDPYWRYDTPSGSYPFDPESAALCPWNYGHRYGVPSDRLWVRETWQVYHDAGNGLWSVLFPSGATDRDGRVFYRATTDEPDPNKAGTLLWRSPLHMPRWASRLTLEVTGVRAERLNSISDEDARAEGAMAWLESLDGRAHDLAEKAWCRFSLQIDPATGVATDRGLFAALWDQTNGKRPGCSWADNPFVWVVEFKLAPGPRKD